MTYNISNRKVLSGPMAPVLVGNVSVPISYADSFAIDAFGRSRVSEPFNLFDTQLQYSASPLFWETVAVGGGTATHLPNESAVRMRVTTANNDSVIRQSKRYHRYQPGKSQLILMTGVMGAAKANVRQRIGYFDAANGVFFEQTGAGLGVVQRSYVTGTAVDTRVEQADWNIDQMDGTGISGVAIDTSRAQIFIIDLEWLGVGRVRCGFVINGIIYYCHQFTHANVLSTVYMTTANLPVRYEIVNVGDTAGNTDLYQICSSVSSEGGVQERNLTLTASNGVTLRSVSTALLPVLSIRVATAFPSGGTIVNREIVQPIQYEIFSEDAGIFYQLIYNGTLTNPSWAAVNATHSGVDYDVAATAITGGLVLTSGYVSSTAQSRISEINELASDLAMTLNVAGTVGDILSVACIRTSTTNSDTGAALTWKELY